MALKPEDISYVDIFPPIGIARVGDSKEYSLGPEIPYVDPIPEGGFKDANHKIKRQAARFRVYAFAKDGSVLGEVNASNDFKLTWTVHVANKKSAWILHRSRHTDAPLNLRNPKVQDWPDDKRDLAFTNTRSKLILDPGSKVLEGISAASVPLQAQFYGTKDTPTDAHLGDILTDSHGRLLVLAGDGKSWNIDDDDKIYSGFDNTNWVDTVFDGTVHVSVKSTTSPHLDITVKNHATVISAPPRFATGTYCPSSLYDVVEEIYERPKRKAADYDLGEVNYYRDIHPIFRGIYLLSWTTDKALKYHGPDKADLFFDNPALYDPNTTKPHVRQNIFGRIRAPVKDGDKANEALRDKQANVRFMPRLSGDLGDMPEDKDTPNHRDRWASLTELQYDRLKKWSEGKFVTGTPVVPRTRFDDIPIAEQPSALTFSALQWTIGAAIYPGIEVYWQFGYDSMWKQDAPFRLADSVIHGDLTKGLSLPWQSDFYMCKEHWWPSIRPDQVVTEAYFNEMKLQVPPEELASSLTDRVEWDDGLIQKGDRYMGNTEMVRKWNKLGFVAEQQYDPKYLAIFIEKERHPELPHSV